MIVMILALYTLACLCLGALILGLFEKRERVLSDRLPPGAELATELLLGQGVLASIWVLVALVGWFSQFVVMSLVVISIIGGIRFVVPTILDSMQQIRLIWRESRSSSWAWQGISLLTVLLIALGFTTLERPVFGDATAFYLVLPKTIAASHHLSLLPNIANFEQAGLQGEMHFAALMSLGDSYSAQLFVLPTILAGAILLLAIGAVAGLGWRGQWITLAMLFTSSAVLLLFGDGKVDLFAAALGIAAYFWALRASQVATRFNLFFTGLFTGFAVVAKFSYIPTLLPSIVLILAWSEIPAGIRFLSQFGRRDSVRYLAHLVGLIGGRLFTVGLGLGVAILPHLVKNWVLFGNPFAPFSGSGMGWADQTWFSPETTKRILLTYPFALTFGQYWAQYGGLSPLLLAFMPLGLLLPKPRSWFASSLTKITTAALLGLLCWIIVRPSVFSPRYILVTLLMFIPFAAKSAEGVVMTKTKPAWLSSTVITCLVIVLTGTVLNYNGIVFFPRNTFMAILGKSTECARDGAYCRAMHVVNSQANPGDRVLVFSYHSYWLRPDLLQCLSGVELAGIGDTEIFFPTTPRERWLAVYQRGFRFLLTDSSTHTNRIEEFDKTEVPDWLTVTQLFNEEKLVVYRLDYSNPPGEPLIECRQANPPAWKVVSR